MSRNREMYGDVDVEALAAEIQARGNPGYAALMVSSMLAAAQEEMLHDIIAARQTLNRANFLIYRCYVMFNPGVDKPVLAVA